MFVKGYTPFGVFLDEKMLFLHVFARKGGNAISTFIIKYRYLGIKKEVQENELSVEEVNDLLIDCIQDIKGKGILKLDLRHLDDASTDFFIICSGESNVQVAAIANHVYGRMKRDGGILASHFEGGGSSRWLLLDYFHTVVHVFHPEAREFYQLEELWSDALVTEYEDLD